MLTYPGVRPSTHYIIKKGTTQRCVVPFYKLYESDNPSVSLR